MTDNPPAPTAPPAGAPSVTPPASAPTASASRAGTGSGTAGSGKLRMGELRGMVAAYLDTHPGEHSPGSVARALGRSAGAVGNALSALAARGEAAIANERPARFVATATTASAAVAPPTRAPRTTPATPGASTTKAASVTEAASSRATPPATSPATSPTASPAPSPAASTRTAPSTPALPPSSKVITGPVTRPNGMTYHPRTLADLPDVTALRKLREAGIPALLYGPPGTGKTSLIEAAFGDLITIAGDGDTQVADLIGEYTQKPDGGYEFIYGPLITAMQEGRTLLIDDATLISPKVLAVAYPAMDGRRQITVKAHRGETITAAPGFYVIAGHNPGVHGAVLTEALASRFAAQIKVSTDYDLATKLKIDKRAVQVARNLTTRQSSGDIGWAPQLRELIAFQRIAYILDFDTAIANLVGIAPEEDRDVVASVVATVFGKKVAPLALGRQI